MPGFLLRLEGMGKARGPALGGQGWGSCRPLPGNFCTYYLLLPYTTVVVCTYYTYLENLGRQSLAKKKKKKGSN